MLLLNKSLGLNFNAISMSLAIQAVVLTGSEHAGIACGYHLCEDSRLNRQTDPGALGWP